MGWFRFLLCSIALVATALAQSDRGALTGTVSDASGAVIAAADIVATNTATGETYKTATSETGNYTLAELPVGVYRVEVSSAGFERYIQQGITVLVAQTLRVDVKMQLGSSTQSVTVTADATLLRTENAEQSLDLNMNKVEDLPLYGPRAGEVGLRTPFAFVSIVPGTTMLAGGATSTSIHINGMTDTFSTLVDGQEATLTQQPSFYMIIQPGVDALQEVALQGSNFDAQYGQVGSGLINFTSKSGTNQFHGSGMEYFRNEDMYAGTPFTNSGHGHLLRPQVRSNAPGASFGGPVWIPHIYNGKNKTFFFVNFEDSYQQIMNAGTFGTVPTMAERGGDFSAILTGRTLATDPAGRPIMENSIYDPSTAYAYNGTTLENAFPNNQIPASRFDPVASKIQAMLPAPTNTALVNNWAEAYPGTLANEVVSVKFDHSISDRDKLSFFYNQRFMKNNPSNGDALGSPMTSGRIQEANGPTLRLSYDRTITPTLLFHAGIGIIHSWERDAAPNSVLLYNAPANLGLNGAVQNTWTGQGAGYGFPELKGVYNTYGGIATNSAAGTGILGPTNSNYYVLNKPTIVTSLMWVHGNHTFKWGAEWRKDASGDRNVRGAQGIYTFANTETDLPSTNGQALSGTVGFPYASFLLGTVDNAAVSTPQDPQFRKIALAFYAQDTWKITRKLTLNYGVRYDYQTAFGELFNRWSDFSPNVMNPSVGRLGGMQYAGNGPGTINGQFTHPYKYGFAPRIGFAYNFLPSTVLRGGFGVVYGQTGNYNYISNTPIIGTTNYNELFWTPPGYALPSNILGQGLQYTQSQLYPTALNPGVLPPTGVVVSPPYWIDPGGGRPPRIAQWNIAMQHSFTTNLSLEVAYVGNRGTWITSNGMVDLNRNTPQSLLAHGFDITQASARSVLTSTFLSGVPQAHGFQVPYPTFPITQTLAQALRPFPQFLTIPDWWSPLGNSWYDGLQSKLIKRVSHGLDVSVAFTYEGEHVLGVANVGGGGVFLNDVTNRNNLKSIGPNSVPFILSPTFTYKIPFDSLVSKKWMKQAIGGWNLGGVFRYQSGLPLAVPTSNNGLNSELLSVAGGTIQNRVPGVPLYSVSSINCHCFNPQKTFVLNPAAWADAAPGTWGTAADYYNDYRSFRRDTESASLGRYFQIAEGKRLEIRAVFFNIFNRTLLNDPTATNAQATQSYNAGGGTVSGFGYINTGSTYQPPRQGLLMARFTF